jgi:hypothetical protein
MARRKDLAGLATLAGLAYMASRDKEGGGSGPSPAAALKDDQYNPDVKQGPREEAADLGEIRDETGALSKLRRNTETGELYDPTGSSSSPAAAPARSVAAKPKTVVAKAPANPNYGNEGRRTVAASNPNYGNEGRNVPKPASSKTTYETPYDRMNRENREQGKDFDSVVRKVKERIATAGDRGKALPLESTKADKNEFMGSTGLKKGGSVKGWGMARGARKAKTY